VDPSGGPLAGAACELVNGDGRWLVTTPGSAVVHRSRKDLDVTCRGDGPDGSASVVSHTTASMLGNIVMPGGLVGAIVDHFRGAAYSYPQTLRIVMGQKLVIGQRPRSTWSRSGANPPQWTKGTAHVPARANGSAAHPAQPIGTL
jgi:hypothetical protein